MTKIAIEGLSFTYSGCKKEALKGIDLNLRDGAFCLLTGSNGSGKTTLLRCIKRELAPAGTITGSIKIDDEDILNSRRAKNVSIVQQDPDAQIVCDTVLAELAFSLENLGFPQDVMERRIAEASAFFGISELLDRRTHELSEGEKQMITLASACITAPEILLLDEPTSHLDERATRDICAALFEMNRDLGMTILVSTHSPRLFEKYATETIVLDEGQLQVTTACFEDGSSASSNSSHVEHIRRRSASGDDVTMQMKDVSFKFDSMNDRLFSGVDLKLSQGSALALLGPNGSGKSTFIKLAAGILAPQNGAITRPLSISQAYLPQDVRLLFSKETVEEELLEVAKFSGSSSQEVVEIATKANLASSFEKNPYDLSDGQRQLLGVIKVVLSKARIVLLDEPTTGLDERYVDLVARLINGMLDEGSTIIFSTHDIRFAANASTLCSMIYDGRLTKPTTSDEFFETSVFMRDEIR